MKLNEDISIDKGKHQKQARNHIMAVNYSR